jgi:cytosine deaminase
MTQPADTPLAWFSPPESGRYWLDRVRLVEGGKVREVSVLVVDGLVMFCGALSRDPGGCDDRAWTIDGRNSLLLPPLIDCHVHLDKCCIVGRCPSPEGDLMAAIEATERDKRAWTEEDLRRRAAFALATAESAGVGAVRTHVDHVSPHAEERSTPSDVLAVMAAVRDEWRGRIEVQCATLSPIDRFVDQDDAELLADQAARHGFVLGAFCYDQAGLESGMRNLFRAAASRGLDVDLHVDEGLDPSLVGLETAARVAIDQRFGGRVLCGHCSALAVKPPADARRIIDMVAEARFAVVTLPTTNLYLQDRAPGSTPRQRGLTLVHELRAAGVPVAVATDNVRDPFYPYGDFDPVLALALGAAAAHLPPVEWLDAIGAVPGLACGFATGAPLEDGAPADFVLCEARDPGELLSRPAAARVVVRAGRRVDCLVPDYAILDELLSR